MSLVVQLKPGPEGSGMAEIAELHPSEFTKSETAIKALKRKRWFGLLSTEGLKEAHFDPTPLPTDHTIDKYHKRIRTQLPEDRQKLHFSIPFEGQLNSTMDILEKLQSEMVKTQSEMAKTQSEMAKTQSEMAKTQSEMAKTQSEIEEMKKKHESDTAEMKKKHENDIAELKNKARADKLMLFFGNMLITLARRLAKQYKPAITDDPCTSKLQQFVMSIKDTQLREAGVPTKIWPFLRDFHKVRISKIFLT